MTGICRRFDDDDLRGRIGDSFAHGQLALHDD